MGLIVNANEAYGYWLKNLTDVIQQKQIHAIYKPAHYDIC